MFSGFLRRFRGRVGRFLGPQCGKSLVTPSDPKSSFSTCTVDYLVMKGCGKVVRRHGAGRGVLSELKSGRVPTETGTPVPKPEDGIPVTLLVTTRPFLLGSDPQGVLVRHCLGSRL